MKNWKTITAGLGSIALLAGCAGGDEAEAETSPEPQPTVTVTETAEPEPEPEAAPEDEWLDEIWDDHVDGIVDWWAEYNFVDACSPELRGCYYSFDAGRSLMVDFRDAIKEEDSRRPDYVDDYYQAGVTIAAWEVNLWSVQCSISTRSDECEDQSVVAHDAVEDVMNEALGWYEIEDGQRVAD